jgi:hypothetical protein
MLGREARVSRTPEDRNTRNSLAIPKGCITVIGELGRPLKGLTVSVKINDHPKHDMTTDDFGRIYPLVNEIDDVTLEVADAHESGRGDSLITDSGHHFQEGGDAPA